MALGNEYIFNRHECTLLSFKPSRSFCLNTITTSYLFDVEFLFHIESEANFGSLIQWLVFSAVSNEKRFFVTWSLTTRDKTSSLISSPVHNSSSKGDARGAGVGGGVGYVKKVA